METITCFFNECNQAVVPGSWKCVFHRHRSRCQVDDCRNQVYARSLCVRHGGKRKCEAPDCGVHVRQGRFCTLHGPKVDKPRCTEEGCEKQAHMRSKCVRHGGGRLCKVQHCTTYARGGGLCWRHRKRDDEAPSHRDNTAALPSVHLLLSSRHEAMKREATLWMPPPPAKRYAGPPPAKYTVEPLLPPCRSLLQGTEYHVETPPDHTRRYVQPAMQRPAWY
ncbi:hypothetical protein SPRG_08005 [Saprolegnia parasitica CBS 223.65]|uniref:WRKY19-like zinc finger domain-containing protein n=1 Tax=Saprolegnia parasitica (strain CBS 223.65) TaxID=695850 RepID=A0A067CJ72_SAPPC|nr:hypothetical protein SPRG_08005 [Saprolegnia parasitica CBS 223.65]KDO26601.1 hypothetical protein SPRG_08005 [Saprolegnia parasitica CBS 223.65]|eukprot:XP_012202743.1 hypothetical protein SPRG_08005 [Saprolegnia parasitica CBS 223.65]